MAAQNKPAADAMGCTDNQGLLPQCGLLAVPYVPYQQANSEVYKAPQGMIRGTLFPGLDLPFMGMVNKAEKDTPLGELQALSFALNELGLYLDTHKNDMQALELFKQYQALYRAGMEKYQQMYGPLQQNNAGANGEYNWLQNPWPWEFEQAGGNA